MAKNRIVEKVKRFIRDHHERCEEVHARSDAAHCFVSPLGSQWDPEVKSEREGGLDPRPCLEVNEMWPIIHSITGKAAVSQYAASIEPLNPSMTGPCKALSKAVNQLRRMAGSSPMLSRTLRSAAIGGVAATRLRSDVFGAEPEIFIDPVPISETVWDTRSKLPNFEDRRFGLHGYYAEVDDLVEEYPRFGRKIRAAAKTASDDGPLAGNASSWDLYSRGHFGNSEGDHVFVIEAEWKTRSKSFLVAIPVVDDSVPSSELSDSDLEIVLQGISVLISQGFQSVPEGVPYATVSLDAGQWDRIEKALEVEGAASPWLDVREVWDQRISFATVVGGVLLASGTRREATWNLRFLTSFLHEESGGSVPHGLADLMRDRQIIVNVLMSQMADVVGRSPSNSLFVDQNSSPESIATIQKKISTPGSVIPMSSPKDSVSPVPHIPEPQGAQQLFEWAHSAMPSAVGASRYGTGSYQGSLSRTSGSLVAALSDAQGATTSEMFGAFETYLRDETEDIARHLIYYWSRDEVVNMVGPDLEGYVPEDLEDFVGLLRRGMVVTEKSVGDDDSAIALQFLTQLYPMMQQSGVAPPPAAMVKLFEPMIGPEIAASWLSGLEASQRGLPAPPGPPAGTAPPGPPVGQ